MTSVQSDNRNPDDNWRWDMAIDPVCKMNVEPDKAAARVDYAGQSYYFCSDACHKAFTAEPQKYADIRHGGSQHHGHK
jgi:YHS domain-containing protein